MLKSGKYLFKKKREIKFCKFFTIRKQEIKNKMKNLIKINIVEIIEMNWNKIIL